MSTRARAILAACPRLARWPVGAVVAEALAAALAAVDPRARTAEATTRLVDVPAWNLLAVGKAAHAMAAGARAVLGPRVLRSLVVSKHPPPADAPVRDTRCGDHPLPGPRSLASGRAIAAFLGALPPGSGLCVLLSGGASSLAVLPAPGLDLADLTEAGRRALAAGWPIERTNALRMRLDRLKGGGLRRLAGARPVVGLVLCDVPDGAPWRVGSSPLGVPPGALPDARTLQGDAARLGLAPRVLRALAAAPPIPAPVPLEPVGRNADAVRAAASALVRRGLPVFRDNAPLRGPARAAGEDLARAPWPKGTGARVLGGETTVRVTGDGTGGRNTELALAAALALDGSGPVRGVVAFATDGEDGVAPSAGGVADPGLCAAIRRRGIDPAAALSNHDSYPALAAAGAAIALPPTGTNVADLAVAVALDGAPRPART